MSEMWVRGIPSAYKSETQKPLSLTTSQLNSNFNGLCLRIKTWYRQSGECVSYIVLKPHELWSTNGLKLDRYFDLPYVKSAF